MKDNIYFLSLLIAGFFIGPSMCVLTGIEYRYYLAVLMGIAVGRLIELICEAISEFSAKRRSAPNIEVPLQ